MIQFKSLKEIIRQKVMTKYMIYGKLSKKANITFTVMPEQIGHHQNKLGGLYYEKQIIGCNAIINSYRPRDISLGMEL
jgi:hypothetical protein